MLTTLMSPIYYYFTLCNNKYTRSTIATQWVNYLIWMLYVYERNTSRAKQRILYKASTP
jgi:hypothetical protein